LALALGMPVRELLQRIGSDEITEWMAFYQMEPFGDMRADLRSGVIASTFANANRTKHTRPFTPEDFMPFVDRPEPIDETRKNAAFLNVARFKSMFAHRVKKHG
jgi:hypothetical protein